MTKPIIVPVIMSGGAGTRLWPLSRRAAPKQMHALFGGRTLLQETTIRVPTDCGFTAPIVVCAQPHMAQVRHQLDEIGVQPCAILAEPCPRNTAPCAMIAALAVAEQFGDEALILLLAADHFMADPVAFRKAVFLGADAAMNGQLLTFGPKPTRPETGYGYLRAGKSLSNGVSKLEEFIEKPDLKTATTMLANGQYLWNSGIFLFQAKPMQSEMMTLRPAIANACIKAWANSTHDGGDRVLGESAFRACPTESVDYAIMENTNRGAVVPLDAGWSDVGSWAAIHELGEKDNTGNVVTGSVIHTDTNNCLLQTKGIRIAALGVSDLAVIATDDAVLVLPLDQAQRVRELVAQLDETEL